MEALLTFYLVTSDRACVSPQMIFVSLTSGGARGLELEGVLGGSAADTHAVLLAVSAFITLGANRGTIT